MAATILVIEDYSTHRALLRKVVDQMGGRTLEAADGRSGLAAAREHGPDLIVLDLVLPDIDGLEVLRRLRSDAATAHIPILIVSAVDRQERLIEALGAGADDYVTKPYSAPMLQARMKVLLRAANYQRQLSEDARRATAVAQVARASSAGDLAAVACGVSDSLRAAAGVDRLHLFVRCGDQLLGPCGSDSPEAREVRLGDVVRDPSLGAVGFGEARWVRRHGSRLGPLGRGLEHTDAALLSLHHGDELVGLVVAANEGQPLTEGQVRCVQDLLEPTALALAASLERSRRAESEGRYRVLFEQAGDGVAILDPITGTCRQVNNALAAWVSALPSALVGRAFTDLFDSGSRDAVVQGLATAATGRPLTLGDLVLSSPDAGNVAVELTLRRVRHAGGTELVVMLRDLRGRDAFGMYEHAHADLSQLALTVRAINHAINNPLTCIIGLTQLLILKLKATPEHQPQLDTILTSAERIGDLTKQLREVAVSLGGDEPLEVVEEVLDRLNVSTGPC